MRVFLLLFLSEILVLRVTSANKLRVQRQNLRVRISAVGDTIILKFIRPHVDTRLDGYILGYGNNMFSKQFIQLPENGQPYESEMDAEPKYLIAVQPVKADEPKKQCTGKVDLEKPLHVVIGSVTPSSVLLSWGTLLTTPFTESFLEDCIDEGQFTVRYREKEPRDTWNYQTCPTTSTVIDNLKPDAQYEFEVRADTKTSSGVWSPPVIHSTADQIIDEPYKELNQPKPEKPVLAVQQTFFSPAAVLNKTIPAPLIKHSNPMPKPRKTTGAGGLTAASLSPEDPSTSTQPPYSTHTPIVLPTPKTTIAAQPQKPTTQSSTPKQDPLTEQQHNGTTPKQPTTTEQQPSTTHLPSLPQQTSTLRQHSTTQQEISTTQHYTSTLETHSTTQQEISTTQYQISTLKQHSTTQQQPSTPQQYYHKTQVPTKDQPYTTQQQLSTTQQQLNETSNPKSTQSPITTKPPLPQTQQHTTNQVLPSTVQENPQTTKEQTTITQDSRHTGEIQTSTTLHRLSTTQRSRGTSKHQTYLSPISTSHSQFNTVTPSEQHPNTKPTPKAHTYMSTNIQSSTIPFFLQPSTLANRQDGLVTSQATGISKPLFSTKPPILKEHTTDYHSTTIKPPLAGSGQELTPEPVQPPTTFQYQPQPSTTKQQSSTAKQQASTAKYNRKTESQRENPLTNLKIESPGTPKNLSNPKPKKSKSFTKSDGFQNSPVAEKVTVRKNQPGGQMVPSQSKDEQLLSRPTLTNEVTNRNHGRGIFRNASSVTRPFARNVTHRLKPNGRVSPALPTNTLRVPPVYRNSTINKKRVTGGEHHIGLWSPKPPKGPRKHLVKTKSNQVSETKEKEKVIDLKQVDPVPFMKPLAPPTTEKPAYQEPTPTTTPLSAFNGSRFDTGDNSSVFSPHPVSEIDAMGKKRFVAPHVIYKTDKRPEEPCSVTHSLSFFPDEEAGYLNVTGPPKTAPSNLTVLTVEGCPSFVILDWEKTDNETTEYEVVSSTKGPHGEEEVSVLTTNQTHTAVENLKPESSYEFKVTPKNELGSGPASDAVTFNTESADPRVSEIPTGKNAIWSSFPFKADSYSECNGRQYIKRTWYRKFVGIQLCNSLRYKIYLSDSLNGKFYTIGDQTGHGEDHCQFVDSFLDGRTGGPLTSDQLPPRQGFFRAVRQEPVKFGDIGGNSLINYVAWYECGIPIPGKW